jgi:hypothetical protein
MLQKSLSTQVKELTELVINSYTKINAKIEDNHNITQSKIEDNHNITQSKIEDKHNITQSKIEAMYVKIENIEKNTITILGKIISDFEGISEPMKLALEQTGQDGFTDLETIEQENSYRRKMKVAVLSEKTGKVKFKKFVTTKVTEVLQDLGITKKQDAT